MSHLSLEDYGLIGNQCSSALVSRLGSVDWCCFPSLDSPSHFGALLDYTQGGRFQLMPQGEFQSEQRYLLRTHILETLFETPTGRATLTDWMPLGGDEDNEPVIYRRIEVIQGKVSWQLHCAPRFQYGSDPGVAEFHREGILFRGQGARDLGRLTASVALEIGHDQTAALARFTLGPGQGAHFTWRWGLRHVSLTAAAPGPAGEILPAHSHQATLAYWRARAHRCLPEGCGLSGPWHDAVTRSALILKLLIHPEIGTLSESITTSIPGRLGGKGHERTWDCRGSWIRDSATTLQVLANLGNHEDCHAFFGWLADCVIRDGAAGLQAVYRLDGGKALPERELSYLKGYRGTRPVRVGNLTSAVFQLDSFGHVMLAAATYYRIFHELPPRLWPKLVEIAEMVCAAWRRPDQGYWEARCQPEHFISSKVLCWVALDRALWLAGELRKESSPRWLQEREILHRTICSQGFDSKHLSFVRAFGSEELDSSALLLPLLGFLPVDDVRITGTIDAIIRNLSAGFLIRPNQSDESYSLLCSFWMAQCMALSGRSDEAGERLADLCTYATPLGILGERVDPDTDETSGNFPSALSHVQLINTALYIGASRGRLIPTGYLLGLAEVSQTRKSA